MGRIEGAKGDGNPIGKITGSTNLDSWELPKSKPLTEEHTWAGHGPCCLCSRGLLCLASVGKDVPKFVET